jgi:hypothetical protein
VVPVEKVRLKDAASWQWCEGIIRSTGEKQPANYWPVPQAAEIFDAALRVVPDDVDSLVSFVRAWGIMGSGSVPFDYSVWATRRVFRELQRHFAWLRALQVSSWRSPSVPSLWNDREAFLDALRQVLPPPEHSKLGQPWRDDRWPDLIRDAALTDLDRPRRTYPDAYVAAFVKGHFYVSHAREARARDREEQHWRAFGWAIGEHLRFVNPAITWIGGRPGAAWELPRLEDLLWVQLWNLATSGAAIRQCRHCRRWFPVDRLGKVYCSRKCTNRASAAASYEARKLRQHRGRAHSTKNVPGNVPAATHNQPKTTQRHPTTKKKTPR